MGGRVQQDAHFDQTHPAPQAGYNKNKSEHVSHWRKRTSRLSRVFAIMGRCITLLMGEVQLVLTQCSEHTHTHTHTHSALNTLRVYAMSFLFFFLSASPPSQESLRRLPWCTCVSASARQSRAQCCAREFMYVCRKMKNSQARTGHQRGMGGRGTDDDDTHERHTDTNRLTRHTASWLPHTLSWRTHNSGPHSPYRPPQHSQVPRETNKGTTNNRQQGRTREARAGLLGL